MLQDDFEDNELLNFLNDDLVADEQSSQVCNLYIFGAPCMLAFNLQMHLSILLEDLLF